MARRSHHAQDRKGRIGQGTQRLRADIGEYRLLGGIVSDRRTVIDLSEEDRITIVEWAERHREVNQVYLFRARRGRS